MINFNTDRMLLTGKKCNDKCVVPPLNPDPPSLLIDVAVLPYMHNVMILSSTRCYDVTTRPFFTQKNTDELFSVSLAVSEL